MTQRLRVCHCSLLAQGTLLWLGSYRFTSRARLTVKPEREPLIARLFLGLWHQEGTFPWGFPPAFKDDI